MNGLMWFLYLGSVLPPLASGLAFVLGALSIVMAIVWCVWTASYADPSGAAKRPAPTKLMWGILLSALLAVCTNLIPDRETIYLMAGAKGAEVAVTSETGQEILGDIQEVIRYQLQSLKEKPLTGQ